MYQLICPHCEAGVPVSAAKAGDQVPCPQCAEMVAVPKLGELRQLPEVPLSPGDSERGTGDRGVGVADHEAGLSGGRSMAFAALAFVSLICLLGAAFCGINWATLDAPLSSEKHVETAAETYKQVNSARLLREYEDITEYGVGIPTPYPYRTEELKKEAWARNAILFTCGGLIAFCLAFIVGRRTQKAV